MDASPLFDPEYFPVIAATLIGFAGLAAALLIPIWRFLEREEEVADDWTPEAVERRLQEVRTEDVGKEETRTSASPSDASAEQGAAEASGSPLH
jgi:hypothetical protein